VKRARALAVAHKEWREILRDRIYLLLAFVMPALLTLVFGYGMSQDIENVALVIADEDHSAMSRDYAQHFAASRHFAFRGWLGSARDADRLLEDGRVKVVVVIPSGFERQLLAGQRTTVQTVIDGSFTTMARTVRAYVDAIGAAAEAGLRLRVLGMRTGVAPARAAALIQPVQLQVRYLYNQEARSVWAIAPSLIMFTLMLVVPLLTSLSVVREKESGAIYNVYASTITRAEFIAGKLLPALAISALNAVVLWLIATRWFGAPFKGEIALFGLATLLFVVGASGLGLLISFLVRTQTAAMIVTSVLTTLLAMQFSGLLTPISSMTGAARWIARVVPTSYYENAILGTFMKGTGLAELWGDLLFLAGFAALQLVLAWRLFSKRVKS
jgi:ABC-2 type transport system permease protein/ribosome-dependent ATPase